MKFIVSEETRKFIYTYIYIIYLCRLKLNGQIYILTLVIIIWRISTSLKYFNFKKASIYAAAGQ